MISLLALSACGPAPTPPAATPTVLVSETRPTIGSLPETVVGYGSATPSSNGTRTLSSAQAGQVSRILVTPGATVRAGQPLIAFATAPGSLAAYRQAVDALAAASKQRATTAQLLSQQLATRDQLVQAEKSVADARASLDGLKADGAGSASRVFLAPFDGVISAIPVAQGDRTQPGAAAITVARSSSMVVTVGIDPAQRAKVVVGQPVALARLSGGPALHGRVVRVDGLLDQKTRMVNVDVGFPVGALMPGEAVQASIETGRVQGWVVPHEAVVTAGGPARVFQSVGGKAKAVPVTIALAGAGTDVVDGPIDAKLPLIVTGAYQVSDGDAVRQGR